MKNPFARRHKIILIVNETGEKIKIKLTKDEFNLIESAAASNGVSFAEFFRSVLEDITKKT